MPGVAKALAIAGSDSGGGAGIQADLKTFSALGVYGASVITAITAQNAREVTAVEEASVGLVRAQIDAVLDDIDIDIKSPRCGRRMPGCTPRSAQPTGSASAPAAARSTISTSCGGRMFEATVLGAGVAGLSVAAELADRGAAVSVVDRGGGPGPHACSWWAGGMLAPFCEGESAEEPVVRLGQEAAGWWERHAGGVQRSGTLVVALGRDRSELDRFAHRTSRHETLDAEGVAALEPDLAGRFRTALYFRDEAHLDPRATLGALEARLEARGIEIRTGEGADGTVFDCRGLAARDTLADLRGVKGEMLVLRCPDVTLNRPVRLLHPRIPLYVVPRGGGVYMLGATMIEASERGRVTARSLLEMLTAAYALHPAFGEAEVLEIGVDARPAFRDNLPRIRRRGATIHVNGLYRHGFLLAPAMARMAADLVMGGPRPEVMDEDCPER